MTECTHTTGKVLVARNMEEGETEEVTTGWEKQGSTKLIFIDLFSFSLSRPWSR